MAGLYFDGIVKSPPKGAKCRFFFVRRGGTELVHGDDGALIGAVGQGHVMVLVVDEEVLVGIALAEMAGKEWQHEVLGTDGSNEVVVVFDPGFVLYFSYRKTLEVRCRRACTIT